MTGYAAAPGAARGAARGVDALVSRVAGFQRAAAEASDSLSGHHPWGLLGEVWLRDACTELMEEFQGHLRHMRKALDGAKERLTGTASTYSAVEVAMAQMLESLGEKHEAAGDEKLRQLNLASRFYRDHRYFNGMLVALPQPFGSAASTVLDGIRLWGDLFSDDKYNVSTDMAKLGADISALYFAVRGEFVWLRANPIGYLGTYGLTFLISGLYWTKDAADWVTGDPIRTGQAAYNFDSLAEGCRKLASELGGALGKAVGSDVWQGDAAVVARERLAALRDGIDATGHRADQVAAALQLASSIMGTFEGIVRAIISYFILWVVRAWFSVQLAAAATGGVSEVMAVPAIMAESERAAIKAGRMIQLAGTFLRRLAVLMKRIPSALRDIQQRAFVALSRSSLGQKSLNYGYGANFITGLVRDLATTGKHAKLNMSHVAISSLKQLFTKAPKQAVASEFGYGLYTTDKKGNPYPDGKWKLVPYRTVVSVENGRPRSIGNVPGAVFIAMGTIAPYGRSIQYWSRAGDVAPARVIDDQLDLWNAGTP